MALGSKVTENAVYYATNFETKFTYGLFYVTLLGFTAIMSYDIHEMLSHIRA